MMVDASPLTQPKRALGLLRPINLLIVKEVVFRHWACALDKGSGGDETCARDEIDLRFSGERCNRPCSEVEISGYAGPPIDRASVDLNLMRWVSIEHPRAHQIELKRLRRNGLCCTMRHQSVGIENPDPVDLWIFQQMLEAQVHPPGKASVSLGFDDMEAVRLDGG